MTRALLPSLVVAACVAGSAGAQEPSFVLSAYTPPAPATVLVSGAASDTTLAPSAAILPLRLSLLGAMYPIGPAFGAGGCGDASVEAAGTILPTQPYAQLQLTPRLVLHGFSDLGCPGDPFAGLDAGAGGGLTYAASLRPNTWLVGSVGLYGVPGHLGVAARAAAGGGLDWVARAGGERVLSTGLGVTATGRGVRIIPRVGGTF